MVAIELPKVQPTQEELKKKVETSASESSTPNTTPRGS